LAKYLDRSMTWLQQPSEHFDGGGLTRSVWPKKAEKLSLGHAERNILDGRQRTEVPGESASLNRCDFHVPPA
jgi:hypothetical protein